MNREKQGLECRRADGYNIPKRTVTEMQGKCRRTGRERGHTW